MPSFTERRLTFVAAGRQYESTHARTTTTRFRRRRSWRFARVPGPRERGRRARSPGRLATAARGVLDAGPRPRRDRGPGPRDRALDRHQRPAEMPAASTIKIPVMVEVFRQLAAGRFDLNTRMQLRAADKDWGSGDLAGARAGTSYPVSRLLALMIDVSDNTATNMLIRLVGRRQHQRRDGGPRPRAHAPDRLHPRRRAGRSAGRCARARATWRTCSARWRRSNLVDEWSSREMIAILRGQRHNGLLPAAAAARHRDRAQDRHAARHAQRRRHRLPRRGPVRHRGDDHRPADASTRAGASSAASRAWPTTRSGASRRGARRPATSAAPRPSAPPRPCPTRR